MTMISAVHVLGPHVSKCSSNFDMLLVYFTNKHMYIIAAYDGVCNLNIIVCSVI